MVANAGNAEPVANAPKPRFASIRTQQWDGEPTELTGFSVVESALSDVQARAGQIWALIAKPLPLPAVTAMDALLQQAFPKLEHLEVLVDASDDDPAQAEAIPTIKLQAKYFPALRSLDLRNSAAHLTPPLASHLRRIIMLNPPGRSGLLPLIPFLDCLGHVDCLEELEVYNCFAPMTADDPGGYRPLKARLGLVKIEDFVYNISHMLSALILTPYASVRLWANLRGASSEECHAAFTAMLPRDRTALPILRRVTDLTVHCAPELCSIAARVEDRLDFISLSIITDIPTNPLAPELLRYARSKLLEAMMDSLRVVFPGAPIGSLEVIGDIKYVTASTWAAALDCYPALRRLEVDIDDHPASPGRLLSALETPLPSARNTERFLCPILEHLVVCGIAPGTELSEAMQRCFTARKAQGDCAVLRSLTVNLYRGEDLDPGEEERCRDLFTGLAGEKLRVDVYSELEEHEMIGLIWVMPEPYDSCCIQ